MVRVELQSVDTKRAETAAELSKLRSDFKAFHELAESASPRERAICLWYWWKIFDNKYFGIQAERRASPRHDPAMEFYDHGPKKPQLLAQWEREHGNAEADTASADPPPEKKPPA